MTLIEAVVIAAAGFGAGAVNTIVGSGSLITYPVLITLGYPPVIANIANTVGLAPGSVSGAFGYRRELGQSGGLLRRLVVASAVGAVVGASLLLILPASAFRAIVPVLILVATALVAVQPWLTRRLERTRRPRPDKALLPSIAAASIYGGYFSAAQGVILLGLLGLFLPAGIQRHNAVKNVLQAVVNVVAACLFVVTAHPNWSVVGLIASGSLLGAQVGALVGRRIPELPLRLVVIVVGVTVGVLMLV